MNRLLIMTVDWLCVAQMEVKMQLDKVVTPPGVFSPAKTFSLVRENSGFHMIFTGRAMGQVRRQGVAGAAAGAILDKMASKRMTQIEAVEERIRQSSAAEVAKDTKHSLYVSRDAIKEVTFKKGALYSQFPVVVVKASKTWKMQFPEYDETTVRDFFAPLTAQA